MAEDSRHWDWFKSGSGDWSGELDFGGMLPEQEAPKDPQPDDAPGTEYLIFGLGGEIYGVDILAVQEIILPPHLTLLPKSPPHVLGVTNLRGMVVPVIDLRVKLGLEPDLRGQAVVVVVKAQGKQVGVMVDQMLDVALIEDHQVQDPPDQRSPIGREHLKGLVNHHGAMVIILDMPNLLLLELEDDAA